MRTLGILEGEIAIPWIIWIGLDECVGRCD